ncbi:MAG TPA: methyltransferase domain-containing protein [Thermoleophilaceae bacterium]
MEGANRADQPRDRGGGLSYGANAWSGATYERIAEAFVPIHRRMVEALELRPGERFLDLACGTGGVALVAARAGADVAGLDISADQIAKARAAAKEEGLAIRFDEGDAQALPYDDGSFEAVASAFGMIFAPDHVRAANELTRVCGPGARIAITSWFEDKWFRLNSRLRPDYEGQSAIRWSAEEYVRGLLPEFELRFERGESTIAAGSDEECWQLLSSSVPPLKAWLDTLDDHGRDDAGRQYLELIEDGSLTRDYLLVVGARR